MTKVAKGKEDEKNKKRICDRIALNGCVKLINDLDMLSSIIDDVEKMDCEYDIISNSEFNYICDIIYSFEELC